MTAQRNDLMTAKPNDLSVFPPCLYALCLPREIRLRRSFHWGSMLYALSNPKLFCCPLSFSRPVSVSPFPRVVLLCLVEKASDF